MPVRDRPHCYESHKRLYLHLIINEDRTDFIATFTQSSEKLIRCFVDTSLPLNRFYNNPTSLVIHQRLQRSNIIQLTNPDSRDHRRKWFLILWLWGNTQRSKRSSMESSFKTHNVRLCVPPALFTHLSRKLESGFICLSARITDKEFLAWSFWVVGFCSFDDKLGELAGPGRVVEI